MRRKSKIYSPTTSSNTIQRLLSTISLPIFKSRLRPYSDPNIKKVIQKIYNRESKLSSTVSFDTIKDDIILKSNGDLKSAINQLYIYTLRMPNAHRSKSKKPSLYSITQFSQNSYSNESMGEEEDSGNRKDREFTLFHTLGKFLYNKSKIMEK